VNETTLAMALPASTHPRHRAALEAAVPSWRAQLDARLVSLVLFGSVARGDAREDSDVDLLVVAHGYPHSLAERRRPLLDDWARVRAEHDLLNVEWNLVTKTPEEARHRSPLYLDMVEDAIILFDRDEFFASVLAGMRERMRELGSRRVYLPDKSWYWDLKPDFRFGEVVEL
jgi:predicted nucleotidyltransferase